MKNCTKCGKTLSYRKPSRPATITLCHPCFITSPRSEKHKKSIGEGGKGRIVTEETRRKIGRANAIALLGYKHDEEFSRRISERVRGENNFFYGKSGALAPNWKNGATEKNHGLRWTYANKMWRKSVIERDGGKCVLCGSTEKICVDHIKPWSLYPELRLEITNGHVLCSSCHRETETYGGKMNRRVLTN